jgi:hypothetical protein
MHVHPGLPRHDGPPAKPNALFRQDRRRRALETKRNRPPLSGRSICRNLVNGFRSITKGGSAPSRSGFPRLVKNR